MNQVVYEKAPLGARVADRVTGFMGSWAFIVIQTMIVAIWLGANIVLLSRPFDPFPFILLNLAFSTQAAYAAPLILLAGNRAMHRDRLTLEHAAAAGDLADAQNQRLLKGDTQILAKVAALEAQILALEETILKAAHARGRSTRPGNAMPPAQTRSTSAPGPGRVRRASATRSGLAGAAPATRAARPRGARAPATRSRESR